MRLFLFDVDGTLIHAHGAGRIAFTRALTEVYGTAGPADAYDTRGKTDLEIVFDLLRASGVGDEVIRDRLAAYHEAYSRNLEALIANGHPVDVMPGIAELIRRLSARQDALVGLLTGNVESGARAKLRPTGLLPYFRVGAFGSDDADRRRLPAIARQRACALTGYDFAFQQIVIIGDTPLDVDCARACGALCAAVATGQHTYDELASCSPDMLFTDFSDVEAALHALTRR